MRRPWDALAREVARRALAELEPLPDRFDETLNGTLGETEDLALAQTTIVHGDFHHRNLLVDDGRVTGVFDWDIAGPGEWRFDLVNLAFACQMYPKTCEPDALATVIAAVHEHCDAPTAAFLTACQTLRALSMLRSRRPDWLEPASRRMQATLAQLVDVTAAQLRNDTAIVAGGVGVGVRLVISTQSMKPSGSTPSTTFPIVS